MINKEEKVYNATRIFLLLLLAIPCFLIFYPFLMPIIIAIFVAFGTEPLLVKFHARRRRGYFTAGVFLTILLLLLFPITAVVVRLVETLKTVSVEGLQNSQIFRASLQLWGRVQETISGLASKVGLEQNFLPQKEEIFEKVSPFIVNKTTLLLGSLPDLGLSLFVFFCMLFVLITNAKSIKKVALDSNFLPPSELEEVVRTFQTSCYMILISTILIGLLQAVIVAVGSSIFGFHEFVLIFALTFFVSFIPVIGAAPVSFLLAIISFLMGNTGNGIGLLVVTVIAGSIDNILKPLVFSKEEKNLHPVVSLLGIIGAIIVFGLPGLLLGPLLLQVTTRLVPIFSRQLMR